MTVAGQWDYHDGALYSGTEEPARIDFGYHPPLEYDLRYTFTLPSGAAQGTFMSTTGTVTVSITGSTAAGSNRT